MSDGGHWRWNSDITWHYFSSMTVEAHRAQTATNDFAKYHHLRSCIYYAIGTLEAVLNTEMRRHLEGLGENEENIEKKLATTKMHVKRDTWIREIHGQDFSFDPLLVDVFKRYRAIRDEITHPKKRDHSIYHELDNCNTRELVEIIAHALVAIYEVKNVPFPYWVLGWNYVGMNGDATHPMESNNQNGFLWSLNWMGFNVPAGDYGRANQWERQFMTSLEGYKQIKDGLDAYPHDIEPYVAEFSFRPRLCRRWWDRDFILSTIAPSS